MATASHRRRARSKAKAKKNTGPFILGAAGILLLIVAVIGYWSGQGGGGTEIKYGPEDIVYDDPIFAVHEMGEGPAIPFLDLSGPQPDIVVPDDSYDFGRIGPTDVVERDFVIQNTGKAPLTISRAYTTCGCTTAEISARVIPPGKVAAVNIVFDAGFHDTAGQTVRRGLIIENNDPRQSQAEIWIQAAVRSS